MERGADAPFDARSQLVAWFRGQGDAPPYEYLIWLVAERWHIPPPVLQWGIEDGGWSHWWAKALQILNLEAQAEEWRAHKDDVVYKRA